MQPWQPLLSGEDIFITVKGSYGVFLKLSVTFNYFLPLLIISVFRLAWALWWDSDSGYSVIGWPECHPRFAHCRELSLACQVSLTAT